MNSAKTELRVARCAERLSAAVEGGGGGGFVTRRGLAAVLKVSVRTVDEMVAAKEITPVRPHGPLVRFYLPHVVRELTAAAVARLEKLKGAASAEIRIPKSEIRGLPADAGNPKSEVRSPRANGGGVQ